MSDESRANELRRQLVPNAAEVTLERDPRAPSRDPSISAP